jgi:N-acyl-D-amino-acid deacylase
MKILIKNGLLIDGSGSKKRKADILINGELIEKIEENIDLKEDNNVKIIDATNRVVTPGFIDMHNHSDLSVMQKNTVDCYTMQGVTTVVVGQCGFGMAPANQIVMDYYSNFVKQALLVEPKMFPTVKDMMEALEKEGISINMAFFIPQGNVRALFLGVDDTPATEEQIQKMKNVVEEGMKAGAFGMSTGLVYPPGSVTSTEEIIELAKVVGQYDGIYMSHMRNEGSKIVEEGMGELFRIATEANVHAHISHWSVIGEHAKEMAPKVIEIVNKKKEEGMNITADVTTYNDGITSLAYILVKPWVFEDFKGNLSDPKKRKIIIQEIFEKIFDFFLADAPWFVKLIPKPLLKKLIFPILTRKVKVLSVPYNTQIQGLTLRDALKTLYPKKNLAEGLLDFMRDEDGGIIIVLAAKNEEFGMIPMFKAEFACPSSDGFQMIEGNAHPRNYGAFPRIIQRWVNEMKVIPLEKAIQKMTSLPASILGIKDRGLIKEGYKADIVVLDPINIKEKGTYENGHQFPEGIDYVIINGAITGEKGKHLGTLNGQVVRKPQ